MKNYAHDMHGAMIRGYARRLRASVERAVDEAAGWANPYNPAAAKARSRIGLTMGVLLEHARRIGMTEDEITRLLEREKATGRFGCPGQARDRDLANDREPRSEDPSAGTEWPEYDAYVDSLSEDTLKRLLKNEARLRASAQRDHS